MLMIDVVWTMFGCLDMCFGCEFAVFFLSFECDSDESSVVFDRILGV